jgi:small-conductance mechanosensitive channel
VLKDPPPSVRLTEFADSGIAIEVRVWIADPVNGFMPVRSDINVAIWRAFKKAGITIPYPQQDVHIKSMPRPQQAPSADNQPVDDTSADDSGGGQVTTKS